VREKRKEFKRVVEEEKREHWIGYLEGLGEEEGYKWVKRNRDFVVDVSTFVLENGERLERDEKKGVGIMRGLGKREELDQEEEGFEGVVELGMEEVEECVMGQGDKKAVGRSGIGGKVLKEAFKVGWVREGIREVVKRSLELGYAVKGWRKSVGIIMRKPNKLDYGSLNSYRIINLLEVLGKVVERVVARRLEGWGQDGMGDEQYGGRRGRSCMDGVGRLYEKWEKGGKKGVWLSMDVKGDYENMGVSKCEEGMRGLGVDEYLVKWAGSFLRDREVSVRVGKSVSGVGKMSGGTVQGSPLSPIVFMYIWEGALEEVRREEVEGVEMVGCVDYVEFMVVGEDKKCIKERVRRMEVGLERGLKK